MAEESISPIDIEIAAHAVGDDGFAQGVYLFRLKCGPPASCGLERITLNECRRAGAQESPFSPRVDSWATYTGQLEVRRTAGNELELTVYQAFEKKLPAKLLLTFASGTSPRFKELTALSSTGFIDFRAWPSIDQLIAYGPLDRDSSKVLDCPVALRGLKP
jgi:hypothetical protein